MLQSAQFTQPDQGTGGRVLIAFLISAFVVVEFLNCVILPITLQTVEVWSSQAKTVTNKSAAAVAKIREQAKADLETEQARINTARAPYAVRYRSAEFRKTTAEGLIASMDEQLRNATIRAETISLRVQMIVDCIKEETLKNPSGVSQQGFDDMFDSVLMNKNVNRNAHDLRAACLGRIR